MRKRTTLTICAQHSPEKVAFLAQQDGIQFLCWQKQKVEYSCAAERRRQLTGKAFLRKNDEVSFGAICGISSIVILGTRHAWKTVLLKYEYVALENNDTVSSSFTSCEILSVNDV